MPFELRPYPTETLKPEGDYLQKTWESSVYPMAEHFGVRIVLPKVSPQPYTHLAFEGYQYAKEKERGNEYNHRILVAFFQEELDIGNIDVLTKLAGELGLDEQEYRQVLETRKYKEVHQYAIRHAYTEARIQAVPTIIIGDKKVQGMRSKEELERIIKDELDNKRKHTDIDFEGTVCGPEGCT